MEKECCQCGSTEKLFQLECGKYGCMNCLDALAQEQNEMKEYIEEYLIENFQISNPSTRAKTLQSIAIQILLENGLLDEETKKQVIDLANEMKKEMLQFE